MDNGRPRCCEKVRVSLAITINCEYYCFVSLCVCVCVFSIKDDDIRLKITQKLTKLRVEKEDTDYSVKWEEGHRLFQLLLSFKLCIT